MKLSQCEIWAGDGTFRSVPALFKQLYSLHAVIDEHTLPLVYILSSRKCKTVYQQILEKIKELLPDNIKLCRMLTDYELSFVNAFKNVFIDVHISGCFFHYTQCVWRNVQAKGLHELYDKNIRIAENIRMLMAIAFVPTNDVIAAYNELIKSKGYIQYENELSEILDYFESTWIGILKRNKVDRNEPLFEIKLWNCYSSVLNDETRSNNGIEGWHRSFNALVQVHHANIIKFVSALKSKQTILELKLVQLNTGVPLPKRRCQYHNHDARLKTIVTAYNPNMKLQYLKNVAGVLRL
ncbi:uncharacterized protein LOC106693620 [Microplitis demolitor]|uniref:uncharacterized protein LOC106693620 n=1 Tax=Microplitis demolitor TaxID=69319 RepID=UPI0006D51AEC|nr:uncharacterized protein LOC106693620 [Microplitis demolitor]